MPVVLAASLPSTIPIDPLKPGNRRDLHGQRFEFARYSRGPCATCNPAGGLKQSNCGAAVGFEIAARTAARYPARPFGVDSQSRRPDAHHAADLAGTRSRERKRRVSCIAIDFGEQGIAAPSPVRRPGDGHPSRIHRDCPSTRQCMLVVEGIARRRDLVGGGAGLMAVSTGNCRPRPNSSMRACGSARMLPIRVGDRRGESLASGRGVGHSRAE